MDSDRIRTDTNSDVTIYHILFRIRIQILSNTNTKMDISNSDSHSNTYSIYNIVIMSINFVDGFIIDQIMLQVETKL
jgi:hypothetical protein